MTNNKAIELLDNLIGMVEDNHGSDYDKAIHMAIDALKAADVVKVVRCKDCEHGQSYNMFGSRYCLKHNDVAVRDNDFCSYGERAEE